MKENNKRRVWLANRSSQTRAVIRANKQKPCADCGIQYPYYVMEYDHVRGEKKFNIACGFRNYRVEVILAEIAKCDVVCANCHAARTWQRLHDAGKTR